MSQEDRLYPVRPVTVSMGISADAVTVFDYVSNTRNDPQWCPNVTDVHQVERDGVELGARFEFHQSVKAGGRNLESDVNVEIVELGAQRVRWRVEDRFQVRDVLLCVEPDGSGSRVIQTTAAAFKRKPGLARWLYPMLARRTFRNQFRLLGDQVS